MHAIRIYEKLRLYQPLGLLFEPDATMPQGATADLPLRPRRLDGCKPTTKPASSKCAETATAPTTSSKSGSSNGSASRPPPSDALLADPRKMAAHQTVSRRSGTARDPQPRPKAVPADIPPRSIAARRRRRWHDGEAGSPDWAVHSGCHFVANFNLRLAQLVEPTTPWRIVTAPAHSPVWDGQETLWDNNFSALGVAPDEAWSLARTGGRILKIGKERRCYDAQPGREAEAAK